MITMDDTESNRWCCSGYSVPKSEIVFFSQVFIVYIVIITSIVNLSINTEDKQIWLVLLSSGIGYLLPNPTLRHEQRLLPQPAQQYASSF